MEDVNDKEEVNKDKLWKDYLEDMKKCQTYASDVEVQFMHQMLKQTIVVVMSSGKDDPDLNIKGPDQGDRRHQIVLGHEYENHYISLEPADEHSKGEYYSFT